MLPRLLSTLALVARAVSVGVRAQETDTEKGAARDVLKRMAALEQSLDVPGWVARLTGAANPARDQVVAHAKELMDRELAALADAMAPSTRSAARRRTS